MEKRRFWWCLRPCGCEHKTFLTEHAVWFFTELSEGFRLLFSWFEWWEKANALRQGHRPPYRFFRILQKSNRPSPCRPYFFETFQCVEAVRRRTLSHWSQIRPNTFPHRFVLHLWHHDWAFSAAGHWKPRLHRHLFSVNLLPFQHIARVHPPRDSDLANSFL